MPCLPLFLPRHNNALNRLLPMRIYRRNKKNLFLALTAESELPYMPISPAALSAAKDASIIYDMLLDYGLPLTTPH